MESSIELIADNGRAAYIARPGRKFPGVALQGDTLFTWLFSIAEAVTEASDEGQDSLRGLGEELYQIVARYVEVCAADEDGIPFVWPDPVVEKAALVWKSIDEGHHGT